MSSPKAIEKSRAMVVEVRAESWAWGAILGVASLLHSIRVVRQPGRAGQELLADELH